MFFNYVRNILKSAIVYFRVYVIIMMFLNVIIFYLFSFCRLMHILEIQHFSK